MASKFLDEQYINRAGSYLDRFRDVGNGTYNCRCPYCGDSQKSEFKARGYFYVSKNDRWRYKCHNCAINVYVSKFFKDINSLIYKEYILELKEENKTNKSFDKIFQKKKEIKIESNKPNFNQPIKHLVSISELHLSHPAKKYLMDRYIPKHMCDKLFYIENLKESINIPEYNIEKIPEIQCIVIPYYNSNNDMVAIQVRNLDKTSKMRYLTFDIVPDANHIFNLYNIDKNKPVYVFEGAFDSMLCENGIACSGSSIVQKLNVIKQINPNIVVVFDNDYKTNKDILKLLKEIIDLQYNVVLYDNTMSAKDINQHSINKGGLTTESITDYLKRCTKSPLEAKIYVPNKKESNFKNTINSKRNSVFKI